MVQQLVRCYSFGCKRKKFRVKEILKKLNDEDTFIEVSCERAFRSSRWFM